MNIKNLTALSTKLGIIGFSSVFASCVGADKDGKNKNKSEKWDKIYDIFDELTLTETKNDGDTTKHPVRADAKEALIDMIAAYVEKRKYSKQLGGEQGNATYFDFASKSKEQPDGSLKTVSVIPREVPVNIGGPSNLPSFVSPVQSNSVNDNILRSNSPIVPLVENKQQGSNAQGSNAQGSNPQISNIAQLANSL